MCFTIGGDRTPTFGESARDLHRDHVNQVQERHARLSAEAAVERMRAQLWAAGIQPQDSTVASTRSGSLDPMDSPRDQEARR